MHIQDRRIRTPAANIHPIFAKKNSEHPLIDYPVWVRESVNLHIQHGRDGLICISKIHVNTLQSPIFIWSSQIFLNTLDRLSWSSLKISWFSKTIRFNYVSQWLSPSWSVHQAIIAANWHASQQICFNVGWPSAMLAQWKHMVCFVFAYYTVGVQRTNPNHCVIYNYAFYFFVIYYYYSEIVDIT